LRSATGTAGAAAAPAMVSGGDNMQAVAATTNGPVFWSQVFGSRDHIGGNDNVAKLGHSTDGTLLGLDTSFADTWRLGLVAGYSRSTFDAGERSSTGHNDNYHLGVYGGAAWGALALRSGLAYTWHNIENTRQIAFPGFADTLKSHYDASTSQAFGELGYSVAAGALALEPFANLAYVKVHTDAFSEKGGAAALAGDSASSGVTFSTLGAHAASKLNLGRADANLRATLGWRHAFGSTTPVSSLAFINGSSFANIAGVAIDRDAAVMQLGLDFVLSSASSLAFSYSSQLGSRATDQSVQANLNIKF